MSPLLRISSCPSRRRLHLGRLRPIRTKSMPPVGHPRPPTRRRRPVQIQTGAVRSPGFPGPVGRG
jgi:hypothetical protein